MNIQTEIRLNKMKVKHKLAQVGITKIFTIIGIMFMTCFILYAGVVGALGEDNPLQNEIGEASLIDSSYIETGAFIIRETKTDFGLTKNTIYYTIEENLGKDQSIEIINLFREDDLTQDINYEDLQILTDVEEDVIGLIDVSLGKIKKENQTCEIDKDNETEICVDNYFLEGDEQVYCDNILGDKSCIIKTNGVVETQIVKKYLPLPSLKEKIVSDGLKIENKNGGIPLPKNSIIYLKHTYSHPLMIKANEPSDLIKEYDIVVKNGEDVSILDPSWWNSSWGYKRVIGNLTGNISYFNLSYSDFTSIQTDFGDLRFTQVDNATELNYTISDKLDSNWVTIRVNNLGDNAIIAWWDNDDVLTTGLVSDVYFNPVSAWYLDEASGLAIDSLGINNGTVDGADYSQIGKIGTSFGFVNANTDKVTFGVTGFDEDEGSLAMWVNCNDWDSGTIYDNFFQYRYGSGDEIRIQRYTNGNLYFVYSGTGTDKIVISDVSALTGWHYIGMTWSQTDDEFKAYIDGSQVGTTQTGIPDVTAHTEIVIGSFTSSPVGQSMDGDIDEPKIYSYALTSEQFYQLFTENEPTITLGAEETNNTAPTITANITKPDDVYTNTNWLINLTATDPEELYLDAYTQFYVDNVKTGGEYYFNLTNGTNSQVSTLLSGNFSKGDVIIAEYWAGDGTENTTKANMTEIVLSFCIFSGYVFDEDGTALEGANITIWNQYNVSEYYTNTTNAQGSWKLDIKNSTNTYMSGAYYNNTLIGQLKPYISGTC